MEFIYPIKIEDLKIKLFRKVGLFKHPSYLITLDGFGRVTFNGQFEDEIIYEGTINIPEIFKIFKYAVEIGFFNMKDTYDVKENLILKDGVIDCLSTVHCNREDLWLSIEIDTGEHSKKVCNYLGAPNRLDTLANRIEKVSKTKSVWEKENLFYNEINCFKEAIVAQFEN